MDKIETDLDIDQICKVLNIKCLLILNFIINNNFF